MTPNRRESLHTLINMLEDFGVFHGRTVTIEVVNGSEFHCSYEPALGETEPQVRELERMILAAAS